VAGAVVIASSLPTGAHPRAPRRLRAAVLAALSTVAGVFLILVALRDVFDVLFNESGRAVLAHVVTRGVWRAFRRVGRRRRKLFSMAGPFALLAVVATWALLLIVGWALIFLPHMPDGFTLASGVDRGLPLVDSLYTSMVTLATVGFGDITPDEPLLRIIDPVEALLGFGLLTASISWLLSIYPVLNRRRSLAYEAHLLLESEREVGTSVVELESLSAESIYTELTTRLVSVERDMATFPVAYYFATADHRFSLPAVLPDLLKLAERGTDDSLPAGVRLHATMLREAIDDLAHALRPFHGGGEGTTEELIEAYRRDHLRA
jgi:hypothetical protein